MAYSPRVRARARDLYVAGWGYDRIGRELGGIAKSTLIRWAQRGHWEELREQQSRVEHDALNLFRELTRAAVDSADPQQAYAAAMMAKIAGVGGNGPEPPRPAKVAEALLDALALHPEVGPVVRRNRGEVIRLTLRELERFESADGPDTVAG